MKCYLCKKDFEKSELKKMGKHNYCPSCYQLKSSEEKERRKLIGYICHIFNIKKPTGMIFSQIKNFRENYNIPYKEQRETLYYITEIEKFDMQLKFGIGLVRYKHGDMLAYKDKIQAKKRKRDKAINKNKKIKTESIIVEMKPKTKEKSYREKNIIKLEDWGL